jgi:hypothetical protein
MAVLDPAVEFGEVFDDRGRVNALHVASALDVSVDMVAKLGKLTGRAVRDNPYSR